MDDLDLLDLDIPEGLLRFEVICPKPVCTLVYNRNLPVCPNCSYGWE